jgi:hypothetical protein
VAVCAWHYTTRQKSPPGPRHPELDSGSFREGHRPPQKDAASGCGMTFIAEIFVDKALEMEGNFFVV